MQNSILQNYLQSEYSQQNKLNTTWKEKSNIMLNCQKIQKPVSI